MAIRSLRGICRYEQDPQLISLATADKPYHTRPSRRSRRWLPPIHLLVARPVIVFGIDLSVRKREQCYQAGHQHPVTAVITIQEGKEWSCP